MDANHSPGGPEPTPDPVADAPLGLAGRIRRVLVGRPRDLHDHSIFHKLALVPFLAWVGLGADGLSSSAYGPPDAFVALGEHTWLAVGLALATGFTVLLISTGYSRLIEQFPHGGGGYVVATKLLGSSAGVVSGCALLVDYMLTITTSIAAAGAALFSLLPLDYQGLRMPFDIAVIGLLTILNIRGVKESIIPLVPVFLLFLVTHVVLISMGIVGHIGDVPLVAVNMGHSLKVSLASVGFFKLVQIFARAYSLGGGTYTGIEAVSNGIPMMREPKVQTAQRTMLYMAVSLAITAAGLLICYVLVGVSEEPGKTLNAVLTERISAHWPGGNFFLDATLVAEGALLAVAAQAGFIDGPRVLANMALDGWLPRRFSALSDRLTTQNGIILMGSASLLALLYTHGEVSALVIMYSINVFLTFSLSMLGMLKSTVSTRKERAHWKRRTLLFSSAFLLCATILCVTSYEKFTEGGWLTLTVTGLLVGLCFLIRSHYNTVRLKLAELDQILENPPISQQPAPGPIDPKKPTAVILVGGYNGIGVHTLLTLLNSFHHYFHNLIFVLSGTVDSGGFKGEDLEALPRSIEHGLGRYVELGKRLGFPSTYRYSIGTDPVDDLEKLCRQLVSEFQEVTFVAGQIIFRREAWYHGLLHNQTAYAIQKRLQWAGKTMIILPVRIR